VGEKVGCARRDDELPWSRSPLIDHLLAEREFFIDNLLVQIRSIIDMTLVDRHYAMGV